jgi:quercetin dioxygenase-like cupin family protein
MDPVINIHEATWQDLTGLAGARGYEFIPLVADDPAYTSAYSCEMVRLGPADHSVPHVEPWNHLLYFIEGSGELTIGDRTWPVRPGTAAKVKAGERHALRNHGPGDMLVLTVYDPPRVRK